MMKLTEICQMSQATLKDSLAKELSRTYKDITVGDGYIYAQGIMPVLLVSHLDTVHKELPKVMLFDEVTKTLSSPQGIGGDDRCGVYMILQVIKRFKCSVLFCEDEEIGAVGAEKFIKTQLAKKLSFNYMIEFDRKGSNDAVFYDCANDEFEEFITKEFFETAYGSFTDISVLAPFFGCAAVNLSCGYYNAHTKDEYIVIPEMIKVIEETCKILERTTEDDKFEYVEYDYDEFYSNDIRERYFLIEYEDMHGRYCIFDTMAVSDDEAIGKWCIETDLPFSKIISIDQDDHFMY